MSERPEPSDEIIRANKAENLSEDLTPIEPQPEANRFATVCRKLRSFAQEYEPDDRSIAEAVLAAKARLWEITLVLAQGNDEIKDNDLVGSLADVIQVLEKRSNVLKLKSYQELADILRQAYTILHNGNANTLDKMINLAQQKEGPEHSQ